MSADDKSRNEGRRRLIKSAAAAPVVFTLPSGAALAAASSSCEANSLELFNTERPLAVTASSDKWVRARLQAWKFKAVKVGSNGSENVDGFKYNEVYYKVSDGRAEEVALKPGSKPAVYPRQYYYVLINYPGRTLILDASATDVTPMAGASCWNSLMPGDNLSGDNTIIIP
ncbi:hypothetical protein [Thauera butanivorans]|jgi:hypothetical protein|uniref:hypothetical protein n=1 Tax=Thauera butanivorans TaxID=86174 RepID=UPI000838F575|nr:hypothetical protein [Thauera butanivorans]